MRCWLLAVAVVSALAVSASAGRRAQFGGELRVVAPELPQTFDPALAGSLADLTAASLLFETLFTVDKEGVLLPGLAATVPAPEAGGKLFRVRLRPGLVFHDGQKITAADVVSSLARLLDPELGSPFAVLALPLVGARERGAASGRVSGLVAVSELELQASLAFPYPKWTRGLAHPGAGVFRTPRRTDKGAPIGSGPFTLSPGSTAAEARFTAFDDCPSGRPFVDGLRLLGRDARAAVRALDLKEADVAMFPLGDREGTTGPGLVVTYLAVNDTRLGDRAKLVHRIFGRLVDPADLARLFVRRPAVPLRGLLPSELDDRGNSAHIPLPPGWKAGEFSRLPASLTLLTDASSEDHRRVGERYQIKLRDAGVALEVKRMPRQALRAALLKGDYDAALVTFPALPEPGLALAQVTYLAKGPDVAREQLRVLGGDDQVPAAAQSVWDPWNLPIIPLYAQGLRAVARPGVSRFGFDPSGAPSLADAWFHELPRERK